MTQNQSIPKEGNTRTRDGMQGDHSVGTWERTEQVQHWGWATTAATSAPIPGSPGPGPTSRPAKQGDRDCSHHPGQVPDIQGEDPSPIRGKPPVPSAGRVKKQAGGAMEHSQSRPDPRIQLGFSLRPSTSSLGAEARFLLPGS